MVELSCDRARRCGAGVSRCRRRRCSGLAGLALCVGVSEVWMFPVRGLVFVVECCGGFSHFG